MAREYQENNGDVKALAMKNWFNTNYHYMVPEISRDTEIKLNGTRPFDEFSEAKALGINAKPVVIGAFTFLRLARYTDGNNAADFAIQALRLIKLIPCAFPQAEARLLSPSPEPPQLYRSFRRRCGLSLPRCTCSSECSPAEFPAP